jgi:transposase
MDWRRLQRLGRPELRSLKQLAIDEVYVGKLHRFLTLVYDLDSGAIVSVSKGRGQKALTGFFSRLKRAGVTIRAVATDMAGGYVAAVMKHLWPTQLVFDRFHVMKLMNDKLSTLRRELYRELKDVQRREVLKGVRWLLVKNPENLKQTSRGDERTRLDAALKLNPPRRTGSGVLPQGRTSSALATEFQVRGRHVPRRLVPPRRSHRHPTPPHHEPHAPCPPRSAAAD